MYSVTRFVLNNGQEFSSEREAKKALDNLYGNALTKFAHQICSCNGKYSEIIKLLENNIELMEEIIRLKTELDAGLDNDY